MDEKSLSRIVLRRSKESRVLRSFGIVIYLILILLFLGALIFASNEAVWSIIFGCFLVTFLRGFMIGVRELFRKIILLETYISFTSWNLLPRVYTYNQISGVETIVIKEGKWSFEPETYVKITFVDGRVLKVQKSLMNVRDFRKALQEKAGRKFRKSSKRKKKFV